MVIGGGSGGLASAQRAAEYGANVAVIEQGSLGGTCVNVGCVPKKVMWYAAQHASHFKLAADYGFDIKIKSHNWSQLKNKRDDYIQRLNGIYERNLNARNIRLIRGSAKFKNESIVMVNDTDYSAKKIIIATGGKPIIPEIQGGNLGIDSDGFFALDSCPSKVAIIGSGYIAVELAGVLAALGAEVSLFIRTTSLIRSFDEMLSEKLKLALQHQGVKVIENVIPYSIEGSKNLPDVIHIDTLNHLGEVIGISGVKVDQLSIKRDNSIYLKLHTTKNNSIARINEALQNNDYFLADVRSLQNISDQKTQMEINLNLKEIN